MYAIVEILGQQFKVEQGKKLFVHRMNEAERGSKVEFDKVIEKVTAGAGDRDTLLPLVKEKLYHSN